MLSLGASGVNESERGREETYLDQSRAEFDAEGVVDVQNGDGNAAKQVDCTAARPPRGGPGWVTP